MQNYLLQINALEQLTRGILGTQSDETISTSFGILGFIFWVIVFVAGVVGALLIAKWAYGKYQYEGGIQIAPYRFTWMGKYSSVEGNLSYNDSLDDEIMEELEKHSDLKLIPDIIKQLKKEKHIHVYNFKITDEGEVVDDINKKMRILSPVDLTEPKFTWVDQKGKRSIGALIRGEKRHNVVFYHTSRMITILDENDQEEIWWVVSPVIMTEAKKYVGFNNEAVQNFPVHSIEVLKIEGAKALAQLASFAPTLTEAINKNIFVAQERDNYMRLHAEALEKLENANMKLNQFKHLLTQKEYVGFGKENITPKSVMNFGWLIGMAFAVFIMMKLMPEILPTTFDEVMGQLLGVSIAIGIIGFIWKYYTEQQKTLEDEIEE